MAQLRQLTLLCLMALPPWLLLRGAFLLVRRPKRVLPLREAALCAFVPFMAALLSMVWDGQWAAPAAMLESALDRLQSGEKIHPRPGQTVLHQLQALPDAKALTQLLGNTLLFIPWGFFLPLLWPRFRRLWPMLGMALGLTCLIEGVQLFIGRYVETDDVLLNALGGMSGAGLWAALHRWKPRMDGLLLQDE